MAEAREDEQVPTTASAATIAIAAVATAAVATAASLTAAFITDQLPAVTPPVSVLVPVAAFSVEHFVCSRPMGQYDVCRFVLVSQGRNESFVATEPRCTGHGVVQWTMVPSP